MLENTVDRHILLLSPQLSVNLHSLITSPALRLWVVWVG
jgi:hypothetical protein